MRVILKSSVIALAVAMAVAGCATGRVGQKPADHKPPVPSGKTEAPTAGSVPKSFVLLPIPRRVEMKEGAYAFSHDGKLSVEQGNGDALAAHTFQELTKTLVVKNLVADTKCSIDATVTQLQGYVLDIDTRGVNIRAHDAQGMLHAAMTLRQIARQCPQPGTLPCLHIEDWPDFPNRGVMLDIARCKVPEMETLYALVDKFQEWKFNQLQLYTEHTFAYKDHHMVWEDASPMTPVQIQALDAYCKERGIELVPNQNSFGHMERWLRYPEYQYLGELKGGSDLCPIDPDCEQFLASLYGDLLPNFSSRYFNVCCDETWSLGKGRSKEAVAKRGVGRVYLDFLLRIHELLKKQDRTMMFWGDIIMEHPELIPEVPKDVVVMEWGYEANHPYAEHGKKFAKSGLPFYVCPGTSAWNSLAGRVDNARQNLENAAVNGRANGAIGYLITDWGDGGHWQALPVSYPGYAYGAAFSWAYDANKDIDIARALDAHAFQDSAGVMGKLLCDLGTAYTKSNVAPGNNSIYYLILQQSIDKPMKKGAWEKVSEQSINDTLAAIDAAASRLAQARMTCSDARQITQEMEMTAALMRFAMHVAQARLKIDGAPTSQLSTQVRHALAAEIKPLIPQYRRLWLARNRCGGLKESAGIMENWVTLLEKP